MVLTVIVTAIFWVMLGNFEGKLHANARIRVGVAFDVAVHANANALANAKAKAGSIWIEFRGSCVGNLEVGREQFFLVLSRDSYSLVSDLKDKHLTDDVNLNCYCLRVARKFDRV